MKKTVQTHKENIKIVSVMRDAVNLAFQYFWRKKRIKFNVRSKIVFFYMAMENLKNAKKQQTYSKKNLHRDKNKDQQECIILLSKT